MIISNNDFEILSYIERKNRKQEDCINLDEVNISNKQEINETCIKLIEQKLIENNNNDFRITLKGIEALEPYRVKRAVFLAAGIGSRLLPLTKTTPKPMVKVNNRMMIETLLDAVVDAEIEEIIIVTGHLSEEFNKLKEKYPNLKFVYNSEYKEKNNIASAYVVNKYFKSAYIFDSDLVLANSSLIRKYEYTSNYLGCYVENTDDYRFEVKGDKICSIKIGGEKCYQMCAIGYVNEEDGIKLEQDIIDVYKKYPNVFWDSVGLNYYKENYNFKIRPCKKGDIIEIDTFEELKQIDPSYNCLKID